MIIEISNDYLKVKINSKGAELWSVEGENGIEYIWQGDTKFWGDRALNLFPYIARLTEGKYVYNGEEFHMPIHGFLSGSTLETENCTKDSVSFKLVSSSETQKMYPFLFELYIHYELRENQIDVIYEVRNKDFKTMYFGIGGHPGFNVPIGTGRFEDYYLEFEEECSPYRIGMSEDCFVTGKDELYLLEDNRIIRLRHQMFDDDAVILRDMSKKVTLRSKLDTSEISVSFPDMTYLGIWHTPGTKAGFICIEPWSSLPSRKGIVENLEEQKNLIPLKAKEIYHNRWSMTFL
ncbi:galactose mutarotase-like enzyme [Aequitasia blattaphilus]|uniref:Aldose 1-epimerase family protein n=1 Tax=Aequitasia blattaphilus TaxID=2949332 RepID=A0ABT1EB03_9FIRM|nr:aldose 1-epimerase family protein [Aequitasia blattaphilus]MCP1103018.1 aldose 1-epimerase family protein [Aequitasia blattaphilus]MCR8615658.1 aldose 1-epimerase family protein [Aequitasia blattaphilus]